MATLLYPAITSLDGYIEDRNGRFDWAEPDEEVHGFVNDLEREVGTFLYGRRMYETMAGWETDPGFAGGSPVMRDFAEIRRAAEKIVYFNTLDSVSTSKTRLERELDPERCVGSRRRRDGTSSSPGPAWRLTRSRPGLIDELHLFLVTVVVGGGKRALPAGSV